MLPKIINSTPPPPPTKISGGLKMNKRQARALRQLFCPPTRPAHVPPQRKVKWRLQKKWFNRYEKQNIIGCTMLAESKTGEQITMRVTNVRILKGGGHKRTYDFTAKAV